MSKQRKPTAKRPESAVNNTQAPPEQAAPAIKPPGRVLTGGHGPQSGARILDGPARLRQVLKLAAECGTDQVCEKAADEITRLSEKPDWIRRWFRHPPAASTVEDAEAVRNVSIRPPGRVLTGGHGPQSGDLRSQNHAGRLRAILELSPTCPLDQVLEDASRWIEFLRSKLENRRWIPASKTMHDAL